ncbi:hypothetical protein KSF78_0001524 [Schistosoma japonicum]|nr:hypothetical protein KSF78_0001524 [Schistosoma japonicum]
MNYETTNSASRARDPKQVFIYLFMVASSNHSRLTGYLSCYNIKRIKIILSTTLKYADERRQIH